MPRRAAVMVMEPTIMGFYLDSANGRATAGNSHKCMCHVCGWDFMT